MAPKSKTWFPNSQDRGGSKPTAKSPTMKSPTRIEVKKEGKELDMKVFAASTDVVIPDSFLDDKIKTKTSDVGKLNLRLTGLNGIFDKIQIVDEEPVAAEVTNEKVSFILKILGLQDTYSEHQLIMFGLK